MPDTSHNHISDPIEKPQPIRALGPVDVSRLKAVVEKVSEQVWNAENSAKENAFAEFHHTRHIVFRFIEGRRDHRVSYDTQAWGAWQGLVRPVLDAIAARYGFSDPDFPKVMLARLAAGHEIDSHIDGADTNRYTHKIHVPLQTNSQAYFDLGDETHVLAEGQAYEVNNLIPHGVRNEGAADRIHLIFELYDRAAGGQNGTV